MLCEQCKERAATVHVVRQVNGVREEKWLCEECARQQGELTFEFGPGGIGFSFPNMLSGVFGSVAGPVAAGGTARPEPSVHSETACPVCGTSLADFRRTGLLGCAECYEFFDPALQAIYRRVQGSTEHQGKHPAGRRGLDARAVAAGEGQGSAATSVHEGSKPSSSRPAAVSTPQERLLELRAQLQDAIRAENYEQAAHLRDEIHALEAKLADAAQAKAKTRGAAAAPKAAGTTSRPQLERPSGPTSPDRPAQSDPSERKKDGGTGAGDGNGNTRS